MLMIMRKERIMQNNNNRFGLCALVTVGISCFAMGFLGCRLFDYAPDTAMEVKEVVAPSPTPSISPSPMDGLNIRDDDGIMERIAHDDQVLRGR